MPTYPSTRKHAPSSTTEAKGRHRLLPCLWGRIKTGDSSRTTGAWQTRDAGESSIKDLYRKPRGKSWQARGEPGLVWRGQTAEICMTTAALGDLDKLPVLA